MNLTNPLIRQAVVFILVFGTAYILSGLLSPLFSDMSPADAWNNIGSYWSAAAANMK